MRGWFPTGRRYLILNVPIEIPSISNYMINTIFNSRLCPVYCCSLFSAHNTARWVRWSLSPSDHSPPQVRPLPSPFTPELARQSWNSWQEFERENLPWLYRCAGPIGLFCPGPGPDVYDLLPDLPRFPGIIPPWGPQREKKYCVAPFIFNIICHQSTSHENIPINKYSPSTAVYIYIRSQTIRVEEVNQKKKHLLE